MHETLTAVNDSTVTGLGRLARFFGFSDVMGRLYGTLLLSPEPLSLDDLGDTLEISKGSVSMNMRGLERWGMWQVIRNVLGSREQREVHLALHVLGESIAKLQAAECDLSVEEQQLARYYLDRIGDLQAFFQFAQLALHAVLGSEKTLDFEAITKIEIE